MTDDVRPLPPELDPRERCFLVPFVRPAAAAPLRLFLRHLGPAVRPAGPRRAVLYVHGATFPSALSIAHRFDGWSWRDSLVAAGFDVWGLDFLGFGRSDRHPEMALPPEAGPPLGRAGEAARQIERAAAFICAEQGLASISLVAHSWGTIAAGRFAGRRPDLVNRLVLFGPIARRAGGPVPALPAWRLVTAEAQWARFVEDVPPGASPVLSRRHFDDWARRWLATDPAARRREPPAVATPNGPVADIADAWAGALAYDPARIAAPVAIVRGAWDGLATDADAAWLFETLVASPVKRDVKIGRATHLMHLEEGRRALWRETETFLLGADRVAIPRVDAATGGAVPCSP